MNIEEIKYSFQNLIHRKMRSWLTVLSILIGIMAIYALVSFGFGIRNYMNTLAEDVGTDKLYIQSKGIGAPGSDETFSLSSNEVNFISKINGVKEVTGLYTKAAQIKFDKETKYSFVIGVDLEKIDFIVKSFTVDIKNGRQLKKGEIKKAALGYNYQFDNKIFNKGVKLGDNIEINGEKFEVLGFYGEVGNPSDDANIYLSFRGFEYLYPESKGKFGYLILQADKGVDPEMLAEKIKDKLRKYKGEKEGKETFFVQTFEDALETFGTIINILNGVLVLIALISLIVASVNIMNTMYTAVLERTNEIGVMKAIGAKNSDILFVFIFESGFLGMVGGIIGVLLGFGVAKMGGAIAAASGYSLLQPSFPWYLTAGCIAFAFFVGSVAGILPAIQASRLKPVDALRYE